MPKSDACQDARNAYAARQWRAAYGLFSAADHEVPLVSDDLRRFAAAAYLIGEEREALELWTRLHQECAIHGKTDAAARWAFWIGLFHLLAGRASQAGGWCARARRLLPSGGSEGPAAGYGKIIDGLMGLDGAPPIQRFDAAIDIAARFDDQDLLAIGLLSRGQALIRSDSVTEGVDLLDEAMVTVTAGRVAPVLAGVVYCAVILTCQSVFDLERAVQWTRELDAWCATQPDLVPYRGQCLVHRSELLMMEGDWAAAEREADKALDHLGASSEMVVGRALYQRGEIFRLRGAFGPAAEMYREADLRGFPPQPGAALLLLVQGRNCEAAEALQTALEASGGTERRLLLLGPLVETLVSAGKLAPARPHAEDLTEQAAHLGAPLLEATALDATGRLLLAERKPQAARSILREALMIWQRLACPYRAALTRRMLGEAHLALAETAAARADIAAAHEVFVRLGAEPDAALAAALLANGRDTGGLTAREVEVLARVAAGETNRQIATALAISEHTVARHLSNIFDKTGTGNRTEASIYAQKGGLV